MGNAFLIYLDKKSLILCVQFVFTAELTEMMLCLIKVSSIFALLSIGVLLLAAVALDTNDLSRKCEDLQQVAKISGFTVEQNPTLTIVSWDKITVGDLDVIYVVYTSSDVGNFTMMTETPSVEILSLYCFILDVEVYAEVEGVAGESSVIRITYGLSPVEHLQITTLVYEKTFVVSWTPDENQEQCDIRYMVTYDYGKGFEIRNTSDSSISLNMVNCTATIITVVAISGDKMSEERSIRPKEC